MSQSLDHDEPTAGAQALVRSLFLQKQIQSSQIPSFQQITTQTAESSVQNINKPTTININLDDFLPETEIPEWTKTLKTVSSIIILATPFISAYIGRWLKNRGVIKEINKLESNIEKEFIEGVSKEQQIVQDTYKLGEAITKANEYKKQLQYLTVPTAEYEKKIDEYVQQTYLDFAEKYKITDAKKIVLEDFIEALKTQERGKGLPQIHKIRQSTLEWYEQRQRQLYDDLRKNLQMEMKNLKIDPLYNLDPNIWPQYQKVQEFRTKKPVEILPEYKNEIIKQIEELEKFIDVDSSIEKDIKQTYYQDAKNTQKIKDILNKYNIDSRPYEQYFDMIDSIGTLIDQEKRLEMLQKELSIQKVLYQEESPLIFTRDTVQKQCFDYLEGLITKDISDEYVRQEYQRFVREEIIGQNDTEEQRQTAQKIFDDIFDNYDKDMQVEINNKLNEIYKSILEDVKQEKIDLFKRIESFDNIFTVEEDINNLEKILPYQPADQLEQYKKMILDDQPLNQDFLEFIQKMDQEKVKNIQTTMEILKKANEENELNLQRQVLESIEKNIEDPLMLQIIYSTTDNQQTKEIIDKIINEQANFINGIYNDLKEAYSSNSKIMQMIEESQQQGKMTQELENEIRKTKAGSILLEIKDDPLVKGGNIILDSKIEGIKDKQIQRYLDSKDEFSRLQLPNLTKRYQFDFINGTEEELEEYIKIMQSKKYFNELAKQHRISINTVDKQPQYLREIYQIVQEEIKPQMKEFRTQNRDNQYMINKLKERLQKGVIEQFDIFLDKANSPKGLSASGNVENYNQLIRAIKNTKEPLWKQEILAFNYYTNPEYRTPVEKKNIDVMNKISGMTGVAIETLLANSASIMKDMLNGDFSAAIKTIREAEKKELQTQIKYYLETEQMYLQESELYRQFEDQPYRFYNLNDPVLKKWSIFQDQIPYENIKNLRNQKEEINVNTTFWQREADKYKNYRDIFDRETGYDNFGQGEVRGVIKHDWLRQYLPEDIKRDQDLRIKGPSYLLNKKEAQRIRQNIVEDYNQAYQRVQQSKRKAETKERQIAAEERKVEETQKQQFMEKTEGQIPLETKDDQKERLKGQQQLKEGQFLVKLLKDEELPENVPDYRYKWTDQPKADYTLPENYDINNQKSKDLINEDLEELIKKYKTDQTKGDKKYISTTKMNEMNRLVNQFEDDRQKLLDNYDNYFRAAGYKEDVPLIKDLPGVESAMNNQVNKYIERYTQKQTRDNNKIINSRTHNIHGDSLTADHKGKQQKINAFNQYVKKLLETEITDKSINEFNKLYRQLKQEFTQMPENLINDYIPQRQQAEYYNKNYEPDKNGKVKWKDWYEENYNDNPQIRDKFNDTQPPGWNQNRQHIETYTPEDKKRTRADNYIRDRIIEARGWYDDTQSLWDNYKQLSYEQKFKVIKDGIPEFVDRDFLDNITWKNRDKGYRNLPIEIYKDMLEYKTERRRQEQQKSKSKSKKSKSNRRSKSKKGNNDK